MKIATPIVVVSVFTLFAWILVRYIQQRPWLTEIASPGKTLEPGDTYTLTWIPAKTEPQPEFYYLDESSDKSFSAPT